MESEIQFSKLKLTFFVEKKGLEHSFERRVILQMVEPFHAADIY